MAKTRSQQRQLSLFDIEPSTHGSAKWMLIFKATESSPPRCTIGRLDYCYAEFARLHVQFPKFWFAALYKPNNQLHRLFGDKNKKSRRARVYRDR